MLLSIVQSPIVSSDTLRSDHLCSALISEADRLSVVLERSVWQPAAAIAAHGHYGGACLQLPPKLQDIASGVVGDLFEALNSAAPEGCSLGSTEGDGACFMWSLTMRAQAEAINTDPASRQEAKILTIPEHWISAIANDDPSGLSEEEESSFDAFCSGELAEGWSLSECETECSFVACHDASSYGVLACDAVEALFMRFKG
jgi:hypothetical protein